MTKPEVWKDIEGYEGMYQISNFGRLKTLSRVSTFIQGGRTRSRLLKERILKPCSGRHGYIEVGLCKDGKVFYTRIHRLVALAFIPNENPEIFNVVCHRDDNPANNEVSNLYWGTQKTNHADARRNGRQYTFSQWPKNKQENHRRANQQARKSWRENLSEEERKDAGRKISEGHVSKQSIRSEEERYERFLRKSNAMKKVYASRAEKELRK